MQGSFEDFLEKSGQQSLDLGPGNLPGKRLN